MRFTRNWSGGTNFPGGGGAPEILALASYSDNYSADARLLQQIRYSITGGNEPFAAGGYTAQHERHVTTMFNIVRKTPRIWNQLTAAEQHKIDLIMEATMVASAFTTSDSNPYISAHTQQHALDGDTNIGRDWNANWREGMVGGIVAGVAYFGAAGADQILSSYNHAQFLADVSAAGLTNIYQTFNWKAANPTSSAPSATDIEATVHNYHYYGLGVFDYMALYDKVATFTFSKTVAAGLNNGLGYNGSGVILSGADTLPNKGAVGEILEFDSSDADGPRSSATYAYDDFRIDMLNVVNLIVSGLWQRQAAGDVLTRMNVGATDLWYKLDHGYSNYQKGAATGTLGITNPNKGFEFTRPLWESVLKPYLGLS
jgi:hypothetical protein